MRPIVAISYAYPPLKWPRAVQVHRLLQGLAERGHQVTLFRAEPTSAFGAMDPSMVGLPEHPRITNVMVKAYYRSFAVRAAYKAMPWLKALPDEFNAWILPAFFAVGNHLRGAHGDPVVCSFSNPWSDHVVGTWLHKRFGRPWIAHFSDPWASNPYAAWGAKIRRLHERLEAKVIDRTKNLVFVSEETRGLFVKSYGDRIAGKSRVIPHIMAPELAGMKSERGPDERLTITYTGEFYGSRSPVPIFKALVGIRSTDPAAYARLRIRLIGAMQPDHARVAKELGLLGSVELVSPVPYQASLKDIVNADVLLLVDAKSEGTSVFLPSKLVEYLGSGNPILGLTPAEGTSAKVIREMNGIVVEPDDPGGIARALMELLEKHGRGMLKQAHGYPARLTEKFTSQSASEKFSELVNSHA